ncbi:XRE family transcriptional regulator [Roseomonas sp. KE2513]|uniref:helix-turn-helix domain-containing protein n=1 Tax=Roseomonas sp. KE2513 TaxID=2479202 RepID=UPI0018E04E72|nr:helix-turn-helix transcriptional regulator [Roseomonas sp. KE2513]MBI0536681.1 XRE family transcriptional regulator [Roseomonas sp. KE2513]
MSARTTPIGDHLRGWRHRRRMSQMDLALEAEISTRHLSCLETGRAMPSRSMVLRLAEQLDVPLRERNLWLAAAGFAPAYPERGPDDPSMRAAVEAVLAAHAPNPALAVDRHWNLVSANATVGPLIAGVDPALLAGPVNVMRLALHPAGLAPRIGDFGLVRAHFLARLARQATVSGDPVLVELLRELRALPAPHGEAAEPAALALPFRLRLGEVELSFLTTTMVFGTAHEVALSELTVETFFPLDEATREALRRL